VVITSFERIILDALLAGRTPELAALRAQAEIATVERREMSGVGFFTTFCGFGRRGLFGHGWRLRNLGCRR
jgi:hypothetical protein